MTKEEVFSSEKLVRSKTYTKIIEISLLRVTRYELLEKRIPFLNPQPETRNRVYVRDKSLDDTL